MVFRRLSLLPPAIFILYLLTFIQPAAAPYATPSQLSTGEAVIKCGVNTFKVVKECDSGGFRYLYYKCYDGYNQWEGDETACKTSEEWKAMAERACTNHCSNTTLEFREAEAPVGAYSYSMTESNAQAAAPKKAPQITTTSMNLCTMSDSLMKEYDGLIYEMRQAEIEGDKALAERIRSKIAALKDEIAKAQEECAGGKTSSQAGTATQTQVSKYIVEVDKCGEAEQWKLKLSHYEALRDLSENELKQEAGLTKDELKGILVELSSGYRRITTQCETQTRLNATSSGSTAVSVEAEPARPVVADSGTEIDTYYKARIERIADTGDLDSQIEGLKRLRDEIDQIIADMIRYKKEIEASEISGLAEVEIRPEEIRANDIPINTSGKEKIIRTRIGTNNVSIEPRGENVLIVEEGMQVQAQTVSIRENKLMVGGSEVAVPASGVVQMLGIAQTPEKVELKVDEGQAVYSIHVQEDRNLLGFIPVKMPRTVTVNATDPDAAVVKDEVPWWSFLAFAFTASYQTGTFQKGQ